jgi:hypothetical protein
MPVRWPGRPSRVGGRDVIRASTRSPVWSRADTDPPREGGDGLISHGVDSGSVSALSEIVLQERVQFCLYLDHEVALASSCSRRRFSSPAPVRPARVPHCDRLQPRALSTAERRAIPQALHGDRFADLAPAQVWALLLDEGVYLGSQSNLLPAAARRVLPCSRAGAVVELVGQDSETS